VRRLAEQAASQGQVYNGLGELGVAVLYLFPFLCLFVVAVMGDSKQQVRDEQEQGRTIAWVLGGKLLEHYEP